MQNHRQGNPVRNRPRTANGGTTAPRAGGQQNRPRTQRFRYRGERNAFAQARGGAGGSEGQTAYSAPAPWDSAYEQSAAGARTKYNNTMIGLNYNEQAAKQDFGLAPGFNDYQSNPYSRAAALEQSFQRSNRGTLNSYAASGQLYAGSTSNALSANRADYGRNRDSLEKQYREAIQDIENRRLSAGEEMRGTENDAYWKRLEGAEKEPLDASTAPEGKKKAGGKKGGRKHAIHHAVHNDRNRRRGRK